MNRKEQQADLIYKLGLLLRPLQDVVDDPARHNAQARASACARFVHDADDFLGAVNTFARSQPGHHYDIEANAIIRARNVFRNTLENVREDDQELADAVAACRETIMKAILAVPTEVASEVLEAHSPFQAYCKLKAFCGATNHKLVWADPYMGPSLFHRYLNGLSDSVEVALITKDRGTNAEFQAFLDISRLYAHERGPIKYRLPAESSNHDRWLRCDDQLYHLGGSAKDAGKKSDFTITKLEPIPANLQKLDNLLSSGTELFGPNRPNHA
jgi:hypothetical protein